MAQDKTLTIAPIANEASPSLPAVASPSVAAEVLEGSVAAAAPKAAAPVKASGETYDVVVKAPPAKGMLAYLVGPGASIVMTDIDFETAVLTPEDGNLRVTLANGAEILLLDYTTAAKDSRTMVVTEDGKIPAQKLLTALAAADDKDLNAIETAAGPAAGDGGGGLLAPTVLGTGVGSGIGIFSEVIDPYALPRPTDSIKDTVYPEVAPSSEAPLPPVTPPANLPPFARNDLFSGVQDKPIAMTPAQLLTNDTDPNGDSLQIVSVQGAKNGTVTLNADGTVTFTPAAGFTGTASYSYTITDGNGGFSTADVLVQIDPDRPTENNVIAADDAATVPQAGRAITVDVLRNDTDPEGDALLPGSVRILSGPDRGTATVNADGTIAYQSVDSAAGYFTSLVYEVSDARGARDTATLTIEVKPNLNTLEAIDDTGEIIPAGAVKTFNVVANDIDPQGDAFKITAILSGPTRGTATFDAVAGTITYDSDESTTGYTETIVYEITDARGAKDTATLIVRVEPTNNVVAADDTADLIAGQDVRIAVLNNDSDPQKDTFRITRITEQPRLDDGTLRGSVSINADGTLTFTDTPGAREAAIVEFKYEIEDARGALDTAVVRVTIGTAPNGVDANNDTFTVAEDSPRMEITSQLRGNDFDPQNDTFTITSISAIPASQGVLELAAGKVFFTPAANFNGPVTFNYTITDSKGATDTAQVTINVQETPDGLNAGDDAFQTPFNTNLLITPAQVLANDYDPDGTVLNGASIIGFTQPLNGSVSRDASGNFVYNPADTFRGTDSFTYTIRDAQGELDTATVRIRVEDPLAQDNPVDAVNDDVTLAPGATRVLNVLTNDSAPDGGLQFVRVVGALPAGITDLGNGVFRYTAPANTTGQDLSFQYEVRDSDGDTDIATATFHVRGPVNSVIAQDDAVSLVRSTTATAVDAITINVKANDSDPDNDAFDVSRIVSGPAIGTAVLNSDGTITYTADASVRGAYTTTLVYEVTDARGAKDTATVTIQVGTDFNNVDAVNDTLNVPEDAGRTNITATLRANDTDAQNDTFDITAVTQPVAGGTVELVNGQVFFTPSLNYNGPVSFSYTITDSRGATDTATVSLNVTPVVDIVDAVDDAATTREAQNRAGDPVTINVLANDMNSLPGAVTLTGFSQATHGTVVQNTNGTFTYTPNAGFDGIDSFTYTVTNADGATDTATVRITVTPNTVVANNDVTSSQVTRNATVTVRGFNVKANDVDPQDDSFSVTRIVSTTPGITASIDANNNIVYTIARAATQAYTITYEITDSRGATSQATLTHNITAVSPPPPPGGEWGTNPDVGGNAGNNGYCPLVIDLDGHGVTVTSLANSTARFDVNMDGIADATAWFGAGEGILVRDYNQNGTIDNLGELFGTGGTAADGFSDMKALEDTNQDGVVNAQDAGWDQLRVWVDANSDGVSQADELRTLDDVGVKEINLDAKTSSVIYEDGHMPLVSTVTMTDGSTKLLGDVFFTNDGTGHMTGSAGSDVMVFSATADTIDGGQGFDTLKVMSASDIVVGQDAQLKGIEAIDLHNSGTDYLTLNMADVLALSDNSILAIRGDAVDEVRLTGDIASTATVEQDGTTFTSYTNAAGAQVLVEAGVHVVTDEIRTA
jgi:hypothetical protein